MKRGAKWAVGLGLVVGALGAVGLALPRTWHVERSVVIQALPEDIHPLVADFKAWPLWARAPGAEGKDEYGGADAGVGAWWAWNGPKLGRGRMLITRSEVQAGVWMDEAIETEDVNAHGSLTWVPQGGGTRVTWVDEGLLPPVVGGYVVRGVNQSLGEHFEKSLGHLKAEVEKRRARARFPEGP